MENDKERTTQTSADKALLIKTLAREKAKGNWGDNNLKPVAFTACEMALAGSESVSGGIAKGIQAIKSQWQQVCALGKSYIHLNDSSSAAQARI